MSNTLLNVTGLTKAFPGVLALDSVDFELAAGEIHALMGENGAGKSTLIKVLTGVHERDAGAIRLDGKLIAPDSPRAAEDLGISTVYQEINLVPELSVAENICLGRQPRRFGLIDWKLMRERAKKALARLSMDLDVTRSVSSFPPAIQQMVAIGRALDVDARVLVLDEPTSSLDEQEVDELFGVMRQLRSDGLGIVFVTHFLDQVYALSDRITVLRNGALIGAYPVEQLPRLKLIEAMLGRSVADLERRPAAASASQNAQSSSVLSARSLERRGVVGPISFELKGGEVLGLAGLLGSGRSETARMLFGIDPADQGEIRVSDKPTRIEKPLDAIQSGLAFSGEDRKVEGIIPNLSVRENLVLALQASKGTMKKLSAAEQRKLADHYIDALKIKTPTVDTPIKLLSGGNQQKVLLARWLAMQPDIIILDEPTRGIDVGAKAEIEKLIASLSERGVATVLISSELEEITRNCSRVLVLRDRKQVGELSGDDIEPDHVMHVIAQHTDDQHGHPSLEPPGQTAEDADG